MFFSAIFRLIVSELYPTHATTQSQTMQGVTANTRVPFASQDYRRRYYYNDLAFLYVMGFYYPYVPSMYYLHSCGYPGMCNKLATVT